MAIPDGVPLGHVEGRVLHEGLANQPGQIIGGLDGGRQPAQGRGLLIVNPLVHLGDDFQTGRQVGDIPGIGPGGGDAPQYAFQVAAALDEVLEVLPQLGRLHPLANPVEALINVLPVLQRRFEPLL